MIRAPRHLPSVVDADSLTSDHVQALAKDLLAAVATALGREDVAGSFLAQLGVPGSRYPGGMAAARARLARAWHGKPRDGGRAAAGSSISPAQIESLAREFLDLCRVALDLRGADPAERIRVRRLLAEAWNHWRSRS